MQLKQQGVPPPMAPIQIQLQPIKQEYNIIKINPSRIQKIAEETPQFYNSIKMLIIILPTAEIRLITFAISKDKCEVRQILDQIGIPTTPDMEIGLGKSAIKGLNYIVSLGASCETLEKYVVIEDSDMKSIFA